MSRPCVSPILIPASSIPTALTALTVLIAVSSIVALLSIAALLILLMLLLVALLVSSWECIVVSRLETCRLWRRIAISRVLVATVALSRRSCSCRWSAVARSAWGTAVIVEAAGAEYPTSAGAMATTRELRQDVGEPAARSSLPVSRAADGRKNTANASA